MFGQAPFAPWLLVPAYKVYAMSQSPPSLCHELMIDCDMDYQKVLHLLVNLLVVLFDLSLSFSEPLQNFIFSGTMHSSSNIAYRKVIQHIVRL